MKPVAMTLAILAATLLRCSGSDQVAGGSTSTDNARVAGIIVTSEGAPASGVIVNLFPPDYNPVAPLLVNVQTDTTDPLGGFTFEKVPENLYSLEALDPVTGSRLLVLDVVVFSTADSIVRAPDTLKPAAAVLIPLDSTVGAGGHFYVVGGSSTVMIDNAGLSAGAIVFGEAPADVIIDIAYIGPGLSDSSRIIARQIRISPADTAVLSALPATWLDVNIGETLAQGGAALVHDTMIVTGGGLDIWVWADGFHFVCQPLIGDGSIQARVLYLENTGPWAKAAVMIRESLTPESPHATVSFESLMGGPDSTPGIAMHDRKTVGGASNVVGGADMPSLPCWIKLQRTGSVIEGFASVDGVTWVPAGTDTIDMKDTVYAGLAVTSHNTSALATALFDNVKVDP